MAEYTETEAELDTRTDVLGALAQGNGWAFVQVSMDMTTGEKDLKVEVGGFIQSTGILRAILEQTLEAMP